MEKRRLQQRLAQMEQEEREEEEAEEREPIVTSISFVPVLREISSHGPAFLKGPKNGPGEGDSGTKGTRAEGPHIRAARGHHSERSRNAFRAEPFRTFRYPGEPSTEDEAPMHATPPNLGITDFPGETAAPGDTPDDTARAGPTHSQERHKHHKTTTHRKRSRELTSIKSPHETTRSEGRSAHSLTHSLTRPPPRGQQMINYPTNV